MKVVIIDGQGGKLGKAAIERIKAELPCLELVAIGTNSIATSNMLKAGAELGATGENPVIVNAHDADIIIGPLGIISANSFLGEITPQMAVAVSSSKALKLLFPVNKCSNYILGVSASSMSDFMDELLEKLKTLYKK